MYSLFYLYLLYKEIVLYKRIVSIISRTISYKKT